jgi:predicted permease
MLKNDLFLAKVLNTELKYQYLKNTPRFQRSDRNSVIQAKKYLVNSVRSSLYVNTFIYGMISVFFGIASLSGAAGMSNDSFILFLLLLILAIMTETQFYRGIWDMKLFAPLTQLPLKIERDVIPFSLFIYNEFYLPFITLPAGLIISYGMRSIFPFITFLIFTILFIYLARTISLLLGLSFVKTNTNRKSKRLYLGQIFQVIFFVIFILAIEIATNPSFQSYVKIPHLLFFLIPVSYQYISSFSAYPFALFAAVFALIYPAYSYIHKRSFTEKMETFASIVGESKENIFLRIKKPVTSLIDKDFKIILRRRGAIMTLVIPITFIIPIVPELLSKTLAGSQLSFYIPYIASVFLIDFILLISLEGKAAWHLSALPLTRRQFFFSKLYSIFIIGLIYYAILVAIVAVANKALFSSLLLYYPFFALILIAVLFAGGTYLVNAIPNEVYSLSQDGIGGRWVFLKTFIIGLPIIIVNAAVFSFAKYVITSNISFYFKGYSLTIIVDALMSYLFLRVFLKRGAHF